MAKVHQTKAMRDTLTDYFLRATGARSIRAIALAADLEPSTLGRQLSGSSALSVETVVAICRHFDLDFADAFVEAGFITEEEAHRLGARIGLAAFSDLELSREIVRRVEAGQAGTDLTEPMSTEEVPNNVRPFPSNVPTSVDDLPRRAPRTTERDKIAALGMEPRETDQPAPGEHPHDS